MNQPKVNLQEFVLQNLEAVFKELPEKAEINVNLEGHLAKRYFYLKQLHEKYTGVTEENFNFYLMALGIETLISKLVDKSKEIRDGDFNWDAYKEMQATLTAEGFKTDKEKSG